MTAIARKNEKGKMGAAAALFRFSFFVFPFSLVVGCAHPKPPPAAYRGPTESMYDVVGAINKNNSKIPTLWASIQRNGLEAFQGYNLLPGDNDPSIGAGPDGVWSTRANPSPDDTTHVLIDSDLGQAGETIGIYNRIVQLLRRVAAGQ